MKNSNVEIKQSNEEMKKQTSSPVDSTRLWAEIAGNEHVKNDVANKDEWNRYSQRLVKRV